MMEFRGVAAVPRDDHGRWTDGSAPTSEPDGFGDWPKAKKAAWTKKYGPPREPQIRERPAADAIVPEHEFAAARKLADHKARNVPQPTAERIAKNLHSIKNSKRAGGELRGNSYVRRERAEALFHEFGGAERGYVPCCHCGVKCAPRGRGGYATMEQDKILTGHEGGTYGTPKNFPNLIPACRGCNNERNDSPYPVRPVWEKPAKKPRGAKVTTALEASVQFGLADGAIVVALPLGWEDDGDETFDRPIQGELWRRTVDAWFGSYTQALVGGEVVDPTSIRPPTAPPPAADVQLALTIPSDLIDADTEADTAIADAYQHAADIAWPRVQAVLTGALAAGAGGTFITQAEWEQIVEQSITEVFGDAALDGVVAAGITVGKLPGDAAVTGATTSAADALIGYGPTINDSIATWIDNGAAADWGQSTFDTEWAKSGPLSKVAAEQVANTWLPAAVNQGMYASLVEAGVAALQWMTQQDAKVRPTHRRALGQTVAVDQPFTVGGAPMRFPGDPQGPYSEIVNCRCYLSFIDGEKPQRVLGSTMRELRVIARQHGVVGRSRLRKADLQMAIIRELCLQGMASGPECPDLLSEMNKATLLVVARGENIRGRYRMTKDVLLTALRDKLGLTVSAFSMFFRYDSVPRDGHGRWTDGVGDGNVKKGATTTLPDVKFGDVRIAYRPRYPDGHADPGEVVWARVPFEDDPTMSKDRPVLIIGRTEDGKNLVAVQLSSKPGRGRIPVGTGDWDQSGRPSYLDMSRFIQIDKNYRREGSYMRKPQFQGLVDQMTKQQGAGPVQLAVDVPRDYHGRWTKGPDGSPSGDASEVFDAPPGERAKALIKAKSWAAVSTSDAGEHSITLAASSGDAEKLWANRLYEMDSSGYAKLHAEQHNVAADQIRKKLLAADDERQGHWIEKVHASDGDEGVIDERMKAYNYYIDMDSSGYVEMNGVAKKPELASASTPTWERIHALDALIETTSSPAPGPLFRGMHRVAYDREALAKVGDVYNEPKFGSWSDSPSTAMNFTSWRTPNSATKMHIVAHLENPADLNVIPGSHFELESIAPRNTKYKVTGIEDIVSRDKTYRILHVRAVAGSAGESLSLHAVQFGYETVPRDWKGQWTKGFTPGEQSTKLFKPKAAPAELPAGKKAAWTKKQKAAAAAIEQHGLVPGAEFTDKQGNTAIITGYGTNTEGKVMIRYKNKANDKTGWAYADAPLWASGTTKPSATEETKSALIDQIAAVKAEGGAVIERPPTVQVHTITPAHQPYIQGQPVPAGSTVTYQTLSGKTMTGKATGVEAHDAIKVTGENGNTYYAPKAGIKTVAKPAAGTETFPAGAPTISPPSPTFGTAVSKPADWATMSPGKKAAWTKKHNGSAAVGSAGKITKATVSSGPGHIIIPADSHKTFENAYDQATASIGSTPVTILSQMLTTQKNGLSISQRTALAQYTGSGYKQINAVLRGKKAATDFDTHTISEIDSIFADPAFTGGARPQALVRGVSPRGRMRELTYKVGQTFTEPKYGSWTLSPSTAQASIFGGTGASSKGRCFMILRNASSAKTIGGSGGESEFIVNRGTNFKVAKITDYVINGKPYRLMEVEVVP